MSTQQSKGGTARAEALTPERRSEIARKAAESRHRVTTPTNSEELPKVFCRGNPLQIGELVLDCAVLDDETRIFTETTMAKQLGRGLGGRSYRLRDRLADKTGGPPLPVYLAGVLEPHISPSLRQALANPKLYRDRGGVRRGVEATLIPEICEAWLAARENGDLQGSQKDIAGKAEELMRALARVGIIALVDEATGYQEVRDRNDLQKILAAYISPEMLPYAQRFPIEFYKQLFRLRGWQFDPMSVKRPNMVGKLTVQLIYSKLPPGVYEALTEKNPVIKAGKRRRKLFQFLTQDLGDPNLQQQIASVTTLMRISPSWSVFKRMFNKAFPANPSQLSLGIGDEEDAAEALGDA